MRKLIFAATLAISSSASAFDIAGYCRQVADAVGGSYQIEETCRKQEQQAKKQLEAKTIPPRIEKYCREVGQVVGGSYQIMNTCVEQELAARDRLE